ncbi:MAG: hypothetical protein R6U10_03560 [Thermoplasmatota archaeon]
MSQKTLAVKVTMANSFGRVKGEVSRTLRMPGDTTLYAFAEAIMDSVGFHFDHPFGFYDAPRYTEAEEGYELFADMEMDSDFAGVEETKVEQVYDRKGKKMLYLFDYGDQWHFVTELLEVDESSPCETIVVTDKVGTPPEQYPPARE